MKRTPRRKYIPPDFGDCFECKKRVATVLPGDVAVLVNHYRYVICNRCTQQILSAHIIDRQQREADLEQKFSLQRNQNLLADTLG